MANATITVKVGSAERVYVLEDIDFDASRDEMSAQIGNHIIDGIWKEVEG